MKSEGPGWGWLRIATVVGIGAVLPDYGYGNDIANDVVVQPDGKIVAVGLGAGTKVSVGFYVGGNLDIFGDFALARYHPDGSLDLSFGDAGKVLTDFGGNSDSASAVALQSDGRIVVAGTVDDGTGNHDFALARYLPDGRLDPDFGTEGIVTHDFGRPYDVAACVAIQVDGKIVVAGSTRDGNSYSSNSDFALIRYESDGRPDASFGTDGAVTTQFAIGRSRDVATCMALQADGRIVLAGSTPYTGLVLHGTVFIDGQVRTNIEVALARYLSDGSLDPDFGVDGKAQARVPGIGSNVSSMALQPDGKILVSGSGWPASGLARFLLDGSLDPDFGDEGKIFSHFKDHRGPASALALQADGKIVVAGSPHPFYRPAVVGWVFKGDFYLDRYHPDGSRDTDFHPYADFSGGDDRAYEMLVQADDKIVVVGSSDDDFALARFESEGELDAGFDGDGKVVTDFDRYQPDNQIRGRGEARIGADFYSDSGIGQNLRIVNRRGHAGGFRFFVENDGTATDSPTVRAPRKRGNFRIRYFKTSPYPVKPREAFVVVDNTRLGPPNVGNVTAEITGRGLTLENMDAGPGESAFEARIRSRKGRTRFTNLEVTSTSEKSPDQKDTVRALVIMGK